MSYAAVGTATRARTSVADGAAALALGAGLGAVLAANGGYFPTSWGWSGTALAWAAALAVALTDIQRPSRLELAFAGGLAAFAGWIALSLAWTSTVSETGSELERMLVYVAGALAVMTIVGVERVGRLLAGVYVGTALVCLYALSTRLFPHVTQAETFAGSRLSTPVGYWNGLGIVAAMSIVLGLVFAARSSRAVWRGAAAAAVPVLATTLYFTFSRGAWLSVFVALAVLVALDRRRLQLVAAGMPALLLAAVPVWRASRMDALTHTSNASIQAAAHEGRTLVPFVLVACAAAFCAAVVSARLDGVWERRAVARAGRIAAVCIVVVGVAAALVRLGSPVTMAHNAYRSFVGGNGSSTDLNSRLFSLSNDGRLPAWRVAWHAFEQHPVGGIGAGGFENAWNQHRTTVSKIRDAHNFYVETLAEDGAVGFVLLIGTLLIPFGAIRRAREHPLAAGALAAYVAYLVHVIADWDWELSGVTLVALFCGGSVLVLARRGEGPAPRKPLLSLAVVVGAIALSGLAANLALDASTSAVRVGDTSRAVSDARLAHWLMPWAAAPLQALGAAQPHHAVANYRAALAKSPGDYRLWIALAKAQTGTARWRDLATALRLNPLDQDEIRQIAQQLLGSPIEGAQE